VKPVDDTAQHTQRLDSPEDDEFIFTHAVGKITRELRLVLSDCKVLTVRVPIKSKLSELGNQI
jgi:hypothetical protein